MQASTTINAARARRPASAPEPHGKDSWAWPKGEDWLYGHALTYVRRQRAINVNDLARELAVTHGTARAILKRMQAEGLIGEPDLLGQQHVVDGGRHQDAGAQATKAPSECIAACGSGEPCDASRCPLPEGDRHE